MPYSASTLISERRIFNRFGAHTSRNAASPRKAPADLSSVSRCAGSPASSTTLLTDPLTPNRIAAHTTIVRPVLTAVSRGRAGTTASTMPGTISGLYRVPEPTGGAVGWAHDVRLDRVVGAAG